MSVNNKRRRVKVGDIYGIQLDGNSFGYCIVLEDGITGFFDLKTCELIQDVDIISCKNILFKVWIMKYSYKNGNWFSLGNIKLSEDMKKRVLFFKQDLFDYSQIYIYYEDREKNEVIEIPATYEDIRNLERAAVWDFEHIEDRLRDYFNGVPNISVEQLKPKLLKS
ncbi:hypothetical protein B9T31_05135 [Acinetobacter sp. ANC 4558]|uniref:Imm26 family immunity protein n=1 Tax=Acinetobacter sp. ANC 4558 TaxID=1977876 RepID=UPI000A332CE5|nr:Imm26 family immunity protein [Acinetobacter sp. ANC 4558]OTG86996.1 hypothetical protein B9T31_05135 [Acinetobacter sp. ANC 4558]